MLYLLRDAENNLSYSMFTFKLMWLRFDSDKKKQDQLRRNSNPHWSNGLAFWDSWATKMKVVYVNSSWPETESINQTSVRCFQLTFYHSKTLLKTASCQAKHYTDQSALDAVRHDTFVITKILNGKLLSSSRYEIHHFNVRKRFCGRIVESYLYIKSLQITKVL